MLLIGESVLHVKLKLIDLPAGEPVDQVVERVHCGHVAATDIMHDAARWEGRPIVNHHLRQGRSLCLQKLSQGLNTIKDAGQIMPRNDDSILRYGQPIALGALNGGIQG